jgi:hypothetical protein
MIPTIDNERFFETIVVGGNALVGAAVASEAI